MTEQRLHGWQIRAGFHQMSGKTVPQQMRGQRLW